MRVTKAWKNTGLEHERAGDAARVVDASTFAPTARTRLDRHAANDATPCLDDAHELAWPHITARVDPAVRDSGIRQARPAATSAFHLDANAPDTDREAAPAPLAAGDIIGGRYLLEELIGEGGMGQVWAGFDEVLQRAVAVKWASDPDCRARLEREARIAAGLTSPHFASVYDCGVHGRWTYLVMEKLEGEDLATRLATLGTLDAETSAQLAHEAGQALDALHADGAVHRDISPGNLFYRVTSEGEQLVVIDFGIAQSRTASGPKLTLPGCAVGCPDFAAPEQILGAQNLDGRTDLFSLAAVLYTAMVGSLPFEGVNSPLMRSYKTAPTARKRLLAVNPRLDPFFAKALALDPADRFPCGASMAIDFHARVADR